MTHLYPLRHKLVEKETYSFICYDNQILKESCLFAS